MSILTRNGAERLPRLLAEVCAFADEVVVGVDAGSDDDSETVALAGADVVFRFAHKGELGAARMRIFEHATGDWIFVVDDDKSFEPGFPQIVREIMESPLVTHAWFPRKWIAEEGPAAFLFAPPWYPDWQLRLFRNDPNLVWKPARPHSGYHVLGPGLYESRVALLHFERVWTSSAEREAKLDRYHAGKPQGDWERLYAAEDSGVPRRRCPGLFSAEIPDPARDLPPRRAGILVADRPKGVGEHPQPLWGVEILDVDMVAATHRNFQVVASVRVRNTGRLAWWPHWGIRSACLFFTFHLRTANGDLLVWDCERVPILAPVVPVGDAIIIIGFRAPALPGDYLIEWDWLARASPGSPTASRARLPSAPCTWWFDADAKRLRLQPRDLTGWFWTGLIERISQDWRSRTCGEVRSRVRSRSC